MGFKVLSTHARSPQEEQRKDGNDGLIRKYGAFIESAFKYSFGKGMSLLVMHSRATIFGFKLKVLSTHTGSPLEERRKGGNNSIVTKYSAFIKQALFKHSFGKGMSLLVKPLRTFTFTHPQPSASPPHFSASVLTYLADVTAEGATVVVDFVVVVVIDGL